MKIRLLQLGRRVIDYDSPAGATVASALQATDVDWRGMDLRVNGEVADTTTVLQENDVITLIPRIKGG